MIVMMDLENLLSDFKKHVDSLSKEELEQSAREAEFLSAPGPIFYFMYTLEGGAKGWGYICAPDFSGVAEVINELVDGAFVPEMEIRPIEPDEWRNNKLDLHISKRYFDSW